MDGNTITVTLAEDADLDAAVTALNTLSEVNAELANGVEGDTVAATGAETLTGGVAEIPAGTTGGIRVDSQESADAAITTINEAIELVSGERSKLGSVQNRLEHTIANLDNASENLQAAESRIRDVDMAREMMEFTKNNILSQASQSMLAQANQQPQSVLQLLQ